MEHLLELISAQYGLGPLTLVEQVKGGHVSHNSIVTDGVTKYFFKQYGTNDLAEVEAIHSAEAFFAEGGIPAILPLHTTSGARYFTHDGTHCSLFPFIARETAAAGSLTPTMHASLGAMLARIHLRGRDAPPVVAPAAQKALDIAAFRAQAAVLQSLIATRTEHDAYDALTLRMIPLKLRLVEKYASEPTNGGLPSDHYTHGDYHYLNVFLDANGAVEHVFDFEQMERNPRAIELVRAMDFSCLDGQYSDMHFDNARTFVRAYNTLYPLTASEFRMALLARHVHAARSLWFERQHYFKNNPRFDHFMDRRVLTLEYLETHLDEIADQLMG